MSSHNDYQQVSLVETLSAQPVGACVWLQRARFAAEMMLGGDAVALIAHDGELDGCVAGYVDSSNLVRIEPPKHLEHFSGNTNRIAIRRSHEPVLIKLDDVAASYFDCGTKALLLPWPLGVQMPYALLIFANDESRLKQTSGDTQRAFLMVASNLLRRSDKRALMDASAWIEAEIEKLVNLQNLLKPVDLDGVAGMSLAIHSKPHAYAGGDYYDISRINHGDEQTAEHYGIALADVSGHGPSAVVETAMIDSILRTYPDFAAREQRWGPANVLNYLNRYMFTRQPRPSFVTMFVGEWSAKSATFKYSIAGHPPPILKSPASGRCGPINSGDGIPLQVLREFTWQSQVIEILPGDVLVAYTDGVTEALSPSGVQFGERQLIELIDDSESDPHQIVAAINERLVQHVAGRPFHDDQTVVVARFDGK